MNKFISQLYVAQVQRILSVHHELNHQVRIQQRLKMVRETGKNIFNDSDVVSMMSLNFDRWCHRIRKRKQTEKFFVKNFLQK